MSAKEKIKKSNEETAIIYVKFDEFNYEELKVKEEILNKYCKSKGYKVIKVIYDDEPLSWEYMTHHMRELLKVTYPCQFSKLITCDIADLACTKKQLVAINQLINDGEAEIETINQGILNIDMQFGICLMENIFDKEDLKEPKIYYDKNGNVKIENNKTKKSKKEILFWYASIIGYKKT